MRLTVGLPVVLLRQMACFLVLGLCVGTAGPVLAQQDADEKSADGKPPIDPTHPLYKPLELAYKSRAALAEVKDYEALFSKQERIEGKLRATTMKLKLRQEPFSVYLNFVSPNAGREVIYVHGKNNNQLWVHEAGIKAIVGTISLDPKSRDAMADNRYPVTMLGMKTLLDKIITQWEAEGKFGETKVQYYPEAKLGDAACLVIESSHPTPRNEFKFKMTRLYIESDSQLPVRVEQYAFPTPRDKEDAPLAEEYTYSQVKTNSGLTDKDFDHTNPSYAFP